MGIHGTVCFCDPVDFYDWSRACDSVCEQVRVLWGVCVCVSRDDLRMNICLNLFLVLFLTTEGFSLSACVPLWVYFVVLGVLVVMSLSRMSESLCLPWRGACVLWGTMGGPCVHSAMVVVDEGQHLSIQGCPSPSGLQM